jgi:hypothetical protein
MGTFDFNSGGTNAVQAAGLDLLNPRRLREECLITFKVYDSCRRQECLTPAQLGAARAAESFCIGDRHVCEGEVIIAPSNAATVTVDKLKVKKVIIVSKEANPFKRGYWDVDLKYVFEFRLVFREADGSPIAPGPIRANCIYNKRVTLFGSIGTDIVISTDLFNERHGESQTMPADPYILTEAKAVVLSAEIRGTFQPQPAPCPSCRPGYDGSGVSPYPPSTPPGFLPPLPPFPPVPPMPFPPAPGPICREVLVTIGLFTIIKLFRIVQLLVESKGFCIPEEGEEISPINPCELFDSLDFPMDIFAPPQKPEFAAGVSGNIPNKHKKCCCDK